MVCNRDLTYSDKPEFVDRMIEVGSHHFFKSFAALSLAAAEAEIGEHIGDFREAADHARTSLWHLRKTLEIYRALVSSIKPLEISKTARKILSEFDYDGFHRNIVKNGLVPEENRIWDELVDVAKRIDPVGAIQLFVSKTEAIEPGLSKVARRLGANQMEPQDLHRALTAFSHALFAGQYIAQFNRTTRERYSGRKKGN
ncbi:MAG: hypothetical protein ACRD2L_22485 [Terriglobia bacterium]